MKNQLINSNLADNQEINPELCVRIIEKRITYLFQYNQQSVGHTHMSHHITKPSNRQIDHTLKHIKQLQKKLPTHKDKTPPKLTLPDSDPSSNKQQSVEDLVVPSTPDVQPWLQDLQASSQTLKKQQSIKRQINFMLGVQDESTKQIDLQIQKPDGKKIAKKLQKYQPANSSFSVYYSEKKELEKKRGEDGQEKSILPTFRLKGINLPPIPIPHSYKQAIALSSRLKAKERKRATSTSNVAFIAQIRHIYNLGQTVSEFPGQLIHKIDSASKVIDRKYEQLNIKAVDMMADVGNYHLQEEKDRNYKNNLLSVPRWILRKK